MTPTMSSFNHFRTVAMDMRGYCETDKPHYVSDYTMDKLVGDVKGVIESLGKSP